MSDAGTHQPLSHTVMFWLLSGMALAVAVPCLLVPPMDDLRELRKIETQAQQRVDDLKDQLTRQKDYNEALRRDPLLNARLAQRELGYRSPGALWYVHSSAAGSSQSAVASHPVASSGTSLPVWMDRIYPHQWAALYQDSRNRSLILLMSFTVVVCSLLLYRARSPRPEPHEASEP